MFTFAITPENRIAVELILLAAFFVAALVVAHPRRQGVRSTTSFRLAGSARKHSLKVS